MGDFNINWREHSTPRTILGDSLNSVSLEPLLLAPTHHHDENTHTTNDYICVSDKSKDISFSQEYIPNISKHEVLSTSLSYTILSIEPTPVKRRSYRNFNLNNLLQYLAKIEWHTFYSSDDIDFKVKFLTDAITKAYDIHAPYRVFRNKKTSLPWLSPSIKKLITGRNNAWRAVRRGYKSRFLDCSNSASMWKTVNELGISNNIPEHKIPVDADSLNRHFIGASTVASPVPSPPSQQAESSPNMRFEFQRVNIANVLEAISSAHSNAQGPDQIPLNHIKECLHIILQPFVHICDLSLRRGYFPKDWIRAFVRPLPKKKSATDVTDFRPISLLCAASKLLKFDALKQISSFIYDNNSCESY